MSERREAAARGDDVLDVIDEFGFSDGLVNTDELDAVRIAAEVVALRSVVSLLFGRHDDDYARIWANRNGWELDDAEAAAVRRAMEADRG